MSLDQVTKIILAACISEKSTRLQQDRQYLFRVKRDATKGEIARAINRLFGVEVEAVRVMNMQGKRRSFKNRAGKRSDWKRAYVKLKEGQSINLGMGGV